MKTCPENENPPRSCRQAARLHDAPRQRIAPNFQLPRAAINGMISVRPFSSCSLELPSTACPYSGTAIQSRPSLKEPAISCYTYGVNISPVPLLKAFGSRIINPPKKRCSLIQPYHEPPQKATHATIPEWADAKANSASLSPCSPRQRSKPKFHPMLEKTC